MKALPWHEGEFASLAGRKASLPHALLIQGPRGIGKLAFAQALARTLLCEASLPGGAACGHCAACAWLDAGTHPDLRLVEQLNKKFSTRILATESTVRAAGSSDCERLGTVDVRGHENVVVYRVGPA